MHLGLYHEPVHTDGVSFDTYGPYARYIMGFARYFDHVTVFAPVTAETSYFSGVPLDAPNVTVAALPYFETHAQAYRRTTQIVRVFRRHAAGLDAVIARGTAPLAYVLWWLMRKHRGAFMYHFASDPFEVISKSQRYRGLTGFFARAAYGVEFQIQKFIMRRTYSFTSGEELCRKLQKYTQNIEPVVTSSLYEEDYHARKDTCLAQPVHLLYVGYLRHGKGIDYLLHAVKLLAGRGRQVMLHMVGSGDYQVELEKLAAELQIADRIIFEGFATTGPQLNSHFNAADMFVFPSLSEGSPKVILEAMAHSLPVVATNVGNIPQMLGGGSRGLAVESRSPEAIADGVEKMLDEAAFRRGCIAAGYEFSRKYSVDAFVSRMAEKVMETAAALKANGK